VQRPYADLTAMRATNGYERTGHDVKKIVK
jgi:hypothetical protein